MTIEEAINVLSQATEPANAGKVSRAGYIQIDQALGVVYTALKPAIEAEKAAAAPPEQE